MHKDRERFSRARRDLIDALQLWRMLAETPEDQRDATLQELVTVAERSLAEASDEYLQAGGTMGFARPPPSASMGLRSERERRTGSEGRARTSDMRTEDLMAIGDTPEE